MQSRGFLCPLLCLFLSLLAIGAAPIRQGDALAKFRRETAAAADGGVNAYEFNTLVSDDDLSRRIYDNYGLKEKDKIARLPGQPQGVDFDQYAGYVTVGNRKGRALFYYFAETADPGATSKPLLLWLNGGPGCSSFGYGAMREVGPFRVMSDGKTLYVNPYAWNRVANVLFLESPAGVGFSSSNTTSDYASSGDGKTAEDAYVFLLNWMERFPEYKGRDLYIAGESYAGHYVPQLARTILLHKNLTAAVNLKGIAIGNPVINDDTDYRGVFEFLWTHALISDATVEAIHKFCNFTPSAEEQPKECIAAVEDVDRAVEDLNEYNIYAPLCFSENLTSTPTRPPNDGFDPCTSVYVHAYLNDPDVQKALHANTTNLNHTWSACSHVLTAWLDSPDTILPIIRQLVASQIRVLVYSGDVDGRVPVTSTRYSLNVLKFQVKLPWRAWKVHEEVGGYTTVYGGNLTFATVRSAGHQVPSYQPIRALMLIDSFLRKGVYPVPTIIKIKQIAQKEFEMK